MGLNELVPRKTSEIAVVDDRMVIFKEPPCVSYALVDKSKYSFEYKNDDIEVNMFESDRSYDTDELLDADFDTSVNEKDYLYFKVAVASGLVTGMFSWLKMTPESLEKISRFKEKEWNQYIVSIAQIAGYDKKDIKGAIAFIRDRIVPFVDDSLKKEVQDGVNDFLERLSSHPTIAGLVFSVFTQFSENIYSFDEKGISSKKVPKYYAIGRNPQEKMVYGLLYWAFNLSINMAASGRDVLSDMKIPKEIIDLMKDLYKLPLFKSLPHSINEAEELFSGLIKRLFEESNYKDETGDIEPFSLKDCIMKLAQESIQSSLPVVINECLVRGFYVIKKFTIECKERDIRSFEDLKKIDAQNVLPFNNWLVSKMVLISSGCFVGINVAGATMKALVAGSKNKEKFMETLRAEINVAGVGRFGIAVIADSKYWSDDIKIILQRRNKGSKKDKQKEQEAEERIVQNMISNDAFNVLALNPMQVRALYSLESIAISKDIEHTSDKKEKEKKKKWLDLWQKRILSEFQIEEMEFFVDDENTIYDAINKLDKTEDNLRWFYLLTMELVLFKPYYPLGDKMDSDFKKLKREKYNYIDDQYTRRQTIVSQIEIESMRESYKKYKGLISGNSKNAIVAAGVATVAAVATGGLAYAFAPTIAIALAGEAVAGLHGAALVNASLALVGGGSLAAGGLGMAGGTAIITGGGTLLGIAGSGTASMAAILSQTSSDYWIRQTSKMLVFSKEVLLDQLGFVNEIKLLSKELGFTIQKVEENVKELEQENCSLDKNIIKSSKDCLKYLNRCKTELDKLAK